MFIECDLVGIFDETEEKMRKKFNRKYNIREIKMLDDG